MPPRFGEAKSRVVTRSCFELGPFGLLVISAVKKWTGKERMRWQLILLAAAIVGCDPGIKPEFTLSGPVGNPAGWLETSHGKAMFGDSAAVEADRGDRADQRSMFCTFGRLFQTDLGQSVHLDWTENYAAPNSLVPMLGVEGKCMVSSLRPSLWTCTGLLNKEVEIGICHDLNLD